MADFKGPHYACGSTTGTGSALSVSCGFTPAAVKLRNTTARVSLDWHKAMGDDAGYKLGPSTEHVHYSDIKGSANTDVAIASGSLPTNGNLISTLAAANNTTAFTIALQPDVPRNISISFKNTNAGSSTGNAVDVVIVGTYKGAAQTETISFTALELTSTVQNEVATKYGSKPFDTITSITPSAAQPANWQHGAGPGSKIALPASLYRAASSSVYKLFKNAANLSPSGIVDTTNNTVNFGALSDGDDVAAVYAASHSKPSLIASGGVTRQQTGFSIGTDSDINTASDTIYWEAWKF